MIVTKIICDVCNEEIAKDGHKGIFKRLDAPGDTETEMHFCDSCYRVLTSPLRLDKPGAEQKAADKREEKPRKAAIKMPKLKKTELLIPVTEKTKPKTGRPKKEKPEPLPLPEGETGKRIDYGKMVALYNAGWKTEDIAEELHCGKSTVYNHIANLRKR